LEQHCTNALANLQLRLQTLDLDKNNVGADGTKALAEGLIAPLQQPADAL
jgi:hypothetical protein